ncbi:prepilin-type N-terminal cleavage/methylation domain-containing protein [Erwinia typographi]
MTERGSSLAEMLIALAISSVLLLSAARMLPLLQLNNLRTLMRFQLQ